WSLLSARFESASIPRASALQRTAAHFALTSRSDGVRMSPASAGKPHIRRQPLNTVTAEDAAGSSIRGRQKEIDAMTRWRPSWLLPALTLIALTLPHATRAQDDAGVAGPAFKEGDVITMDQIDKLR